MTIYVNAIGYRDIAFPIVGVAIKFFRISERETKTRDSKRK